MTRAEIFCAGRAEGERWAEQDLRNGLGHTNEMLAVTRAEARMAWESRGLGRAHQAFAAECLGRARGYREAVRRFESGEISWETMR